MRDRYKLIAGMLVGAGLMYILDPDRGARRRALLRDQATRAGRKLGDSVSTTARDLGNRARGTAAEVRARFRPETVDDTTLHERVRSTLGRAVSHPSAVTVVVVSGTVTLQGSVLAYEVEALLRAVRRIRGVGEVVNELQVYREADNVPSLQGGRLRETEA